MNKKENERQNEGKEERPSDLCLEQQSYSYNGKMLIQWNSELFWVVLNSIMLYYIRLYFI